MKKILMITFLFATLIADAQTNRLTVNSGIKLPKDSIESVQLVSALNDFLDAIQQDNTEKWVLPSEKFETELLTDEMKGMDKNDSIDFKPYLINVEALADKKTYSVQVSYAGIHGNTPVLRAIFELIAHKTENGFRFSSPLSRNTRNWFKKNVGYMTYRYQSTVAEKVLEQIANTIIEYDKKLNSNKPTDIYVCDDCDDMVCMLRLAGINYLMDINGFNWFSTNFTVTDKYIAIYTQSLLREKEVDMHDWFHWRANTVIPVEIRNHYMVCGCANIYAGSWEYSWEEIQKMFKAKMKYDKKTDWLKLYFERRYDFGESQAKPLLITQFINSLIIQKVEKEQGFSAVTELLASGNMYNDRENFFRILEKVTGINEKNFNKEVEKLIQNIDISPS
ncbi:MAG: hypothetical protein LBC68_04245 [Prevotellaceae bacterium]|jgi:uncharacterized protein YlaI|nr:hypothetical protein [Prevotellaceae bacterium]